MNEIAIIGISCLFPQAKTPAEFWELLLAGKDVTSHLTAADLGGKDPSLFFHPQLGTPDKFSYTKHGYLRGFEFNPEGYLIPPHKLLQLDRLFHLALDTAKTALQDSGYRDRPDILCQTGLILGNLYFPTEYASRLFGSTHLQALAFFLKKLLNCPQFSFPDPAQGLDIAPENAVACSGSADIVCQGLGLGGTRYSIDAACATSLYAIELASYYLNSGKAKMMLAGAVCSPERIHILHGFSVIHAFPTQGESIPLDTRSQGIKIGEGAGICVLKRLEDAERDGDRIYAVIESIGLSNDGGGQHILSPGEKGQFLALERAYRQNPPPDYVECHATGTAVGDKTELNSLEKFFQGRGKMPLFGANKGHVGHMMAASGMASLIKGIGALQEGIIPATIGIQQPITSDRGGIGTSQIVQQHTSLTSTLPTRIGINAFGFGGTNAHLILRQYRAEGKRGRGDAETRGRGDADRTSNSSPVTRYPLPVTHSTSPVTHSTSPVTRYPLPVTHSTSPVTRYPLPVTHSTSPVTRYPLPVTHSPITIIGMDIHIGNVEGLAAFKEALYYNRDLRIPLPPDGWMGAEAAGNTEPPDAAYLEKFAINCLSFKIPPNQTSSLLFDHLLVMKVADAALRDAGFKKEMKFRNTAVIVATEMNLNFNRTVTRMNAPWHLREGLRQSGVELTEAQFARLESLMKDSLSPTPYLEGITGGITNLAASRVAALWDFNAPAFVVSAKEGSVAQAIEIASFLLDLGKIDAAVVAALDRGTGWEEVELRKQSPAKDIPTFWGEGAGAVVLMKSQGRKIANRQVYATIESLAIAQPQTNSVKEAAQMALGAINLAPEAISQLEIGRNPLESAAAAEKAELSQIYNLDRQPISSVSANVGHSLILSSMAGLIKTALCLYHRWLPVSQQITRLPEPLEDSPQRWAAISQLATNGSCSHLILKEADWAEYSHQKLPTNGAKKQLLKTISSTSIIMKDILWQPQNLEILRPAIAPATPIKQPALLALKETIFGQQIAINAELQKLFYQVQNTFYNNLIDGLDEAITSSDRIPEIAETPLEIVWNLDQINEINQGKISQVLGDYYLPMDDYPIRSSTPLAPFMFVSRVTKLEAVRGELKPCYIAWEYDVPADTWFANNGRMTGAIALESSHVLILALAYIGCDLMFDGKLRYRVLDSETEIISALLPPGQTMRGEVFINKLIKTPKNLLIQYEYKCYYGGQHLITINAQSGYFSVADLENSKGIPSIASLTKDKIEPQEFTPIQICDRTSFGTPDIDALQRGDVSACFGSNYKLKNPQDRLLSSPQCLMVSRILYVNRRGGAWGLGELVGEFDVEPNHWVFKSHFRNDPVMPGTMLSEGCNQVAVFYMYYLGLHEKFDKFYVTWLDDRHLKTKGKFRGEIKAGYHQVQYRITVREINVDAAPYIIAAGEIIFNDKVIGTFDKIGLQIRQK